MGVRNAPQEVSRILDEVSSVGSIAQQLVLDGLPVANTATVCDTTGGTGSSQRSTKVIGGILHYDDW